MRTLRLLSLFLFSAFLAAGAGAQNRAETELGPDSRPQPGVPKGEVLKFSFENSRVFPGTYRDYWVYVPAQYRPDRPACLYVNQDGIQWQAPTVFDNLIHKGEMPVTIGVFVMHGRVRAADETKALDRFNRSLEYDGLGDRYARFLVEELLPEVETKKTSDGRAIRISKDPKDRAIGGSSSGAVCAFTAAWERPDQFSRVFSAIGTYVGLRGADRYPTLIRKFEPKPIRIFLQDGRNDLNIYAGDWWTANQMMERALTWANYEVTHVWGEGGHNNQHGSVVFPDAMRWLWKGWPAPVKAGTSRNNMLNEILVPGESWKVANAAPPVPMGANGARYTLSERGVTMTDNTGKVRRLASGIRAASLVAASNGSVYLSEAGAGKVWLVRPNGEKQAVDTGLRQPTGVTLSPDQTLLYVAESGTHWVYSYQVQPDGTLRHKQQYYWLHTPDDAQDSGAGALHVDRDGRLYVATRLGIQVCDQAGRVNCILPLPGGPVTSIAFGGDDFTTLYATSGDRVYSRKLKVRGANSWEAPNRPRPPGL